MFNEEVDEKEWRKNVEIRHKCKQCGLCCKNEEIGPIVTPNEVKDICKLVRMDYFDFLSQKCDRKTLVICGKAYDIYFIKKKESGCIFLNENNLCSIYNVRPYQCKKVPFQFLNKYDYWKHMRCVNAEDYVGIDTIEQDEQFLMQILKGYGGE